MKYAALEFLVVSKQVKELSREDLESRNGLVLALPERIKAIPDGSTNSAIQTGGWATSSSYKNIKFGPSGDQFLRLFFINFSITGFKLIVYMFMLHVKFRWTV